MGGFGFRARTLANSDKATVSPNPPIEIAGTNLLLWVTKISEAELAVSAITKADAL